MKNVQETSRPVYSYPTYGGALMDDGSESGLDLSALWAILMKKKFTVFLGFVAAIAVAVAYIETTTPIYKATALIELSLRRPRIMGVEDALINDPRSLPSGDHFNTELQKLKRPSMQNAVIENVLKTHSFSDHPDHPAEKLVRNTEIILVRRSSIVQIISQSPDPAQAAAIANTYAETAVEAVLARNEEISETAVKWLKAQAITRRAQLEEAENALLAFRQENNLESLQAQSETTQAALLTINQELVRIETQAALTKETLGSLENIEELHTAAGSLPSSISATEAMNLKLANMARITAERDALLTRYTDKHPSIVELNLTIKATQEEIQGNIAQIKERISQDFALLEKQAASIRARMQEHTKLGAELDAKIAQAETQLSALDRQKESCEVAYKGILNRMEDARISADEKTATVEIVETALQPEFPVHPNKLMILALAFCTGGFLGVFGAISIHALEDRVSSPGDIEKVLNQRILGIVPHASQGAARRDLATISMTDKFSMVAESFGGIRGVLDREAQAKVILVTSSTPAEGKTVSSCNLAIMSAKSGKKTLLVDMDMRRPQQRRVWDIPDTQADILSALSSTEEVAFATLPIETPVPSLEVIVSHSAKAESPAELLGSQRVADFITWARQRYDRVIIDSPPLGSASDSMVLGGLVDGVILVTRFNKSKKGIARAGLRRLTDCGAQILGVIVNDVRQANQKGYYGSFEAYYHGYQYAPYGDTEDKKEQRKSRSRSGKSWKSDLKPEDVV